METTSGKIESGPKTLLASGVYVAALTPMHEDFSCNCEALSEHCKDLIHRGCQGVVLFGTTGEGPSFSVAERIQVIKNIIQLGIDPQKIIIGIHSSSIDDTVKLASLAGAHHCAAVLIAPPFFYKNVSEDGIINFYKYVIQSAHCSGLKILLYHIPQYSGVPITINVIRALREEFPHVVIGVKESEGDLDFTKEVLLKFEDFQVFAGRDLLISEAVQLGAAGAISGLANAYPKLICSLYEYGKDRKNPDCNLMAKNIIQSLKNFPVFPAIKAVVENQKGAEWHVVRPPLIPLNKQQSQALIESLGLSIRK